MTRMFNLYWGAVFIIVPLYLRAGQVPSTRFCKDVLFILLTILSAVLFDFKRQFPPTAKLVLGVFLLACFFNGDFTSNGYLRHLGLIMAFSLFAVQFYSNSENLDFYLNALLISASIQSLLGIVNYLGYDAYKLFFEVFPTEMTYKVRYRPIGGVGTLGNQGGYGAFVALCLPTCFRKKYWILLPLLILGVVLSKAEAAYVASLFGVIYYLISLKNFKIAKILTYCGTVFLSISCIAIPLYFPVSRIGSDRLIIWAKAMNYYAYEFSWKLFLFGYGTGHVYNNQVPYPVADGTRYASELHNEFLELLISHGVIGYIGFFYFLWKFFPQSRALSSIVVICLVNSFFHFTLHYSTTILPVAVALFLYQQKNLKTDQGVTYA